MKDMPDSSNTGQNIFWTRWEVISILIGIFVAGLVIGLLLRSGGGPVETTSVVHKSASEILFNVDYQAYETEFKAFSEEN